MPDWMASRISGAFRLHGCDHGAMPEELAELISMDPAVCHGQPVVKGTRVLVTVILDALAAGLTPAEIVQRYQSLTEERYQSLTEEGVRSAAAYGAWLAKQEVMPLVPGL